LRAGWIITTQALRTAGYAGSYIGALAVAPPAGNRPMPAHLVLHVVRASRRSGRR